MDIKNVIRQSLASIKYNHRALFIYFCCCQLSYMTSIEIWNTLCMVMVLFAFMEMLVGHLIRLVCSDSEEGAADGTGQEKRLNVIQFNTQIGLS